MVGSSVSPSLKVRLKRAQVNASEPPAPLGRPCGFVDTGAQTANQHNIIAGVEFALAGAEAMLDGVRPVERLTGPDIAGDLPFGFLKYERLYREQIDDVLDLLRRADA